MHLFSPALKRTCFNLCFIAAAISSAQTSANDSALDNIKIDLSQSSVSGLSSGGYMATQFQLAHSQTIVGAGIIGAGPYYCALNDITTALGQCVSKATDTISNKPFLAEFERAQSAGLLASPEEIKDDRVFLLHGTLDTTVNRTAADLLPEQYKQWLAPNNLKYVNDKEFAHHFPSLSFGTECDTSETPFIGNCNYDAAGEILSFIYGELKAPSTIPSDVITLDMSEYVSLSGTSIADEAYLYIPKACKDGETCSLHVSFHGCNQSREDVGPAYAANSGFNAWAETNKLIMIYPQVEKSMFMPLNPQGCWDWWGYTDENYANKAGPQIEAIYGFMQALSNQ